MITPESQLLRDAIRAGQYTPCHSDCDHSPRKEWEWAIARIYALESSHPVIPIPQPGPTIGGKPVEWPTLSTAEPPP